MFIYHYLQCFNATDAARRAGYKDGPWLRHFAQKLTTKGHIRDAIQQELDALIIQPAEVLARLSAIASADIGDFLDIDADGRATVNLKKAEEAQKLGLIKKLTRGADGVEIELHDKLDALGKLARIYGLFCARHVHAEADAAGENTAREVLADVMKDPALFAKLMAFSEGLALLRRAESSNVESL